MEESSFASTVPSVRDDDPIQDASFSYAGYQVVRGEFFAHVNEPSIVFNKCKVSVNTACVNKLAEVNYVQILVNPDEMKLAVMPCREDEKDSFLWCGIDRKTGRKKPREITCRLFFAKIVQLLDWNPDYRCAIATLESIYDKYGFHALDRVLRLCIGTWEGDINSFSSNMLNGVARLVSTYGEQLKDDIFKEKVGSHSVKEIGRNAVDRHTGSLGYAEAMLICYNKKMKIGLHMGKLYSSKGRKPELSLVEFDAEIDDDEMDESTLL